jgi:hypothetical protein
MKRTKIIFLNGPPYSGKDTAAKLLREINSNVARMAFADKLKEMFCKAHGFATFPEGPEKDKPMPAPYHEKSWRQGIIAFSENYMKPTFGQDILGKLLLKQIQSLDQKPYGPLPSVAISDLGFIDEALVLTAEYGKKNCCVVQMHRPGKTFLGDSRSYISHEEIGADFTIFLHNNGSLEFLKSELRVLERWMTNA